MNQYLANGTVNLLTVCQTQYAYKDTESDSCRLQVCSFCNWTKNRTGNNLLAFEPKVSTLKFCIRKSRWVHIKRHVASFSFQPAPLKQGMQPYSLLPHDAFDHLIQLENHIRQQVDLARERYRPKVR